MSYHYHVADYSKTPKELGDMASAYIKEKHPALVAICYDSPDHTGHTEGHDTPAYYEKLKELDTYVGQIVQTDEDNMFGFVFSFGVAGKGETEE